MPKHSLSRSTLLALALGFLLLLGLMATQMTVAVNEIQNLRQKMQVIVDEKLEKNRLVQIMLDTSRERAMILMFIYYEDDAFVRDEMAARFHRYAGEFIQARQKLYTMPFSPEERAALDASFAHTKKGTLAMNRVLDLVMLGEDATPADRMQALTLLKEEAIPAREQVGKTMWKIREIAHANSQAAIDAAASDYRKTQQRLWLLGGGFLLVSLGILWIIYRRVTEDARRLQHMFLQLDKIASTDGLTGLPNRRNFEDRLEQTLLQAQRYQRQTALLYIDLDGFKAVNDTLGHSFGDVVLQKTAQRLQKQVREVDTVARLGGDEFVVLLNEIERPENAREVAERIIQAFAEPIPLPGGKQAQIGTSIGIACYPQDGSDEDSLMRGADTAMYQSKSAGKNCFHFAAPAAR